MPDSVTPLARDLAAARDALTQGDDSRAAAICDALLDRYPSYASAWLVRADIALHRDDANAAETGYAAALAGRPDCSAVWFGLGRVAELRGRLDDALAFCQVAWELAPQHRNLRAHLTRLSSERTGVDGVLQLSSPALATLHAQAGRHERAAREFQAALARLPDRVDLRLGLLASLWHLGLDDDAASVADAVLQSHPLAAPALLIQADIDQRSGPGILVDRLVRRLRAVDPAGDLVQSTQDAHPQIDLSWLAPA